MWEQDKLYLDNLDASVLILKKLSDDWRIHSSKQASLDPLREALKLFRQKVIFSFSYLHLTPDYSPNFLALITYLDKYCLLDILRILLSKICEQTCDIRVGRTY